MYSQPHVLPLQKKLQIETNKETIASLAAAREEEHDHFRSYLKNGDSAIIDAMVHRLNKEISPKIDCTLCGNCCRSLMVGIKPEERSFFAEHFQLNEEDASGKYLATGFNGDTIMSNMPCVFLKDNSCTIYEQRFSDCREFPHLHQDGFVNRLFSVLISYGMCPIVFNVVEAMKEELGFCNIEQGTRNGE